MSSSLCVCLPCWTSTVLLILRLPPTAALFPSRRSSDLPLTSHHIAGTGTHLVSRVTTTRRAYPRETASNHNSCPVRVRRSAILVHRLPVPYGPETHPTLLLFHVKQSSNWDWFLRQACLSLPPLNRRARFRRTSGDKKHLCSACRHIHLDK